MPETIGKIKRINPVDQANNNKNNVDVQSKNNTPIVTPRENKVTSITGGAYEPVLITETCHLPSKGIPYEGHLGSTVEFRAMTTVEERMRLSGENFWSTMVAILNRCKCNTDFDMKNLVDFDFFAAIVKLRIVSYGSNYKINSRCISCGKEQELNIDLDTVAVTELPDDFVEPFVIGPLPMSGDVLECRFLRVFDYIDIHNKVSDWQRKHPKNTLDNPEYTLLMEHAIVSVNGVKLNDIQKHKYVESMIGTDSTYYHDQLNDMFYGLHRVGTVDCEEPDCDSFVLYEIAPSESFFRATPLSDKRSEPQDTEIQQDS